MAAARRQGRTTCPGRYERVLQHVRQGPGVGRRDEKVRPCADDMILDFLQVRGSRNTCPSTWVPRYLGTSVRRSKCHARPAGSLRGAPVARGRCVRVGRAIMHVAPSPAKCLRTRGGGARRDGTTLRWTSSMTHHMQSTHHALSDAGSKKQISSLKLPTGTSPRRAARAPLRPVAWTREERKGEKRTKGKERPSVQTLHKKKRAPAPPVRGAPLRGKPRAAWPGGAKGGGLYLNPVVSS